MNKASLRSALFLALYYGTNAFYQGYIGKYYQQLGISGFPLLLLLVSFPATALFCQPLWGVAGDRMHLRNTALLICIGASILLIPLYPLMPGYIYLLLLSCMFAAFYTVIQPMGDSIILEDLQSRGAPFGPVRLFGCLSFAFVNLIAGHFLKSEYSSIPYLVLGGLILLFISSLTLPRCPGHQKQKQRAGVMQVLKVPYVLPLLLLLMPLQLAMGYFYSYYSLHFTALPGGTSGLLGLAYFLSSTSEIPFLLNSDKLFDRYGAGKLMLVSAMALTLRFLLLGISDNLYVALLSQLFHGVGFIVMTLCMSKFIARAVPETLRASGQMLVSIVGFGVARVFGVLGGGVISQYLGISAGFLAMSGVCLLTLVLCAPYFLRKPALNGSNQ